MGNFTRDFLIQKFKGNSVLKKERKKDKKIERNKERKKGKKRPRRSAL